MRRAIRTIVIAGGGSAGWMAAAVLARVFGRSTRITLVESEAIGTIGVGEATIPQIQLFNRSLGIDEGEFVRATMGSFKLGIAFRDWGRPGDRYMHAFGGIGVPMGTAAFHHYWLRARAEGDAPDLWAFSLNQRAAVADKFAKLDRIGQTPIGGIKYAYHFDAGLYAAFLREYAEGLGVARVEGRILDVAIDGANGHITALVLEGDGRVEGDLFIDCSGFRGLLMEALGVGYADWTRWLPCDRAVAAPCASVQPLTPYTRSTARAAGWQWRIPLQHRTGNGHVYASAHVSDDEATALLLANLDGAPTGDPRLLRFTTGMRDVLWTKNCIALGLASGFMEPLESTSLHLVQSGLSRLLALFPTRDFDPVTIAEYNRQSAFEWERIRDFLILHYHANQRDEPFWRACAAMDVPDSLAAKLELFRGSGRIVRESEELFTEEGWLQLLIGQHVAPRGHHPLADALPAETLAGLMRDVPAVIARAVGQMPDHAAFIAKGYAASA